MSKRNQADYRKKKQMVKDALPSYQFPNIHNQRAFFVLVFPLVFSKS